MVLFHDNPDKYNNTNTVERLQKEVDNRERPWFECCFIKKERDDSIITHRQVKISIELDAQVQKMEEEICVNPLYVKKVATGALEEEDGGRSSAASALQAGVATKVPSFSMWFPPPFNFIQTQHTLESLEVVYHLIMFFSPLSSWFNTFFLLNNRE